MVDAFNNPEIQDREDVIAVESFQHAAGYVGLEEYIPEMRGIEGKRVIQTMLDDSTYAAVIFIIRAIFRSRTADIRVPKGYDGDPDMEMKREYLENVLFHDVGTLDDLDSQMSFDDLVSMIIGDVIAFGFAAIHPKFKKRPDGYAGIGRLIQISPDTVEKWEIEDPVGIIRGLYQRSHYDWELRLVPRKEFIHFRSEMNKGNPEGRSLFRSSYKAFTRRERMQTTEAILAERGTGFPVITADKAFLEAANRPNASKADKEIVRQISQIPKNVRMNSQSGAVIWTDTYRDVNGNPTGIPKIKFEFSPVGTTNAVNYREAIRDYDLTIARSLMAQFAMNGTLRGGSRAMDESQTDTFMKAVNGFAELICSVLNRQLVTRLWELNGWSDDEVAPFVVMDPVEQADMQKIGALISSMAGAGAMLFPNVEITNALLDMMGLPPIEDNEDGL